MGAARLSLLPTPNNRPPFPTRAPVQLSAPCDPIDPPMVSRYLASLYWRAQPLRASLRLSLLPSVQCLRLANVSCAVLFASHPTDAATDAACPIRILHYPFSGPA